MTSAYTDRCPACGSNDVTPYAVILGAAETYGYQCLDCAVTWPVLACAHQAATPAALAVPAAGTTAA